MYGIIYRRPVVSFTRMHFVHHPLVVGDEGLEPSDD